MDLSVHLRFVVAAAVTAAIVLAAALLTGSGIPGAVDGLFLIGMLAALIAVLFTRPSVFRKRSIRRAERTDDEERNGGSTTSDEGRSDDGEPSRRSGRNDRSSAAATAGDRRRSDSRGSDSADDDPARKIRIGVGLIAYAGVLLGFSAILHVFLI